MADSLRLFEVTDSQNKAQMPVPLLKKGANSFRCHLEASLSQSRAVGSDDNGIESKLCSVLAFAPRTGPREQQKCRHDCFRRFLGKPKWGHCADASARKASATKWGWDWIIDFQPAVSIMSVAWLSGEGEDISVLAQDIKNREAQFNGAYGRFKQLSIYMKGRFPPNEHALMQELLPFWRVRSAGCRGSIIDFVRCL